MIEGIKTMYFRLGTNISKCLFWLLNAEPWTRSVGRKNCMLLWNLTACYLILLFWTGSSIYIYIYIYTILEKNYWLWSTKFKCEIKIQTLKSKQKCSLHLITRHKPTARNSMVFTQDVHNAVHQDHCTSDITQHWLMYSL